MGRTMEVTPSNTTFHLQTDGVKKLKKGSETHNQTNHSTTHAVHKITNITLYVIYKAK